MMSRIRISTSDSHWKKILSDLNAAVSDGGVDFANPKSRLSLAELENHIDRLLAARISALGAEALSETERRLIFMLPSNANELKKEMGYAAASKTHTVETLIYNIRKKMGNDFIRLENGIYELNRKRGQ
jgi:hypothetical protein